MYVYIYIYIYILKYKKILLCTFIKAFSLKKFDIFILYFLSDVNPNRYQNEYQNNIHDRKKRKQNRCSTNFLIRFLIRYIPLANVFPTNRWQKQSVFYYHVMEKAFDKILTKLKASRPLFFPPNCQSNLVKLKSATQNWTDRKNNVVMMLVASN